MPLPEPENRVFYPALDGLRAVAFILVFLQHYYSMPWGWAGVNVFFVLSGFLITGILFDTRDQPHAAKIFYARRTLRIFPLYYAIFLGLLLLNPILHWHWSWAWLAWPLYLGNFARFVSSTGSIWGSPWQLAGDAMLSSRNHPTLLFFGHFWSLCVEEQFYLLWPWFVFLIRSRKALIWLCGAAVVVTPLLRLVAQNHAPEWMVWQGLLTRATPFQVDSLLVGGLLALLWRGANREAIVVTGRWLVGILGVGACLYLFHSIHPSASPNWRAGYIFPHWETTWGLTLINLFSVGIIVCCLRTTGVLARLFSLAPLRWLGRISYGAYVWHDIFHNVYSDAILKLGTHWHFLLLHTYDVTMVVGFGMTLLLAWLSFRYLETPFLRLKDRWKLSPARKLPPHPVMSVAR
jgi:peptidoglycan/LPS O-acetylase OafA/YrhL